MALGKSFNLLQWKMWTTFALAEGTVSMIWIAVWIVTSYSLCFYYKVPHIHVCTCTLVIFFWQTAMSLWISSAFSHACACSNCCQGRALSNMGDVWVLKTGANFMSVPTTTETEFYLLPHLLPLTFSLGQELGSGVLLHHLCGKRFDCISSSSCSRAGTGGPQEIGSLVCRPSL